MSLRYTIATWATAAAAAALALTTYMFAQSPSPMPGGISTLPSPRPRLSPSPIPKASPRIWESPSPTPYRPNPSPQPWESPSPHPLISPQPAVSPSPLASPTPPPAGAEAGGVAGGGAGGDQTFMTTAATDNRAEIELGRLAVDKTANPTVKTFGQMLVDDHGNASEELTALASRKEITLPTEPTAAQNATKERLSKLSGPAFDAAFAKEMVAGHQKAVQLFTQESNTGADADTRVWAAQTLPALKEHLDKARQLGQPAATYK
jgi:putative membrane protein